MGGAGEAEPINEGLSGEAESKQLEILIPNNCRIKSFRYKNFKRIKLPDTVDDTQ